MARFCLNDDFKSWIDENWQPTFQKFKNNLSDLLAKNFFEGYENAEEIKPLFDKLSDFDLYNLKHSDGEIYKSTLNDILLLRDHLSEFNDFQSKKTSSDKNSHEARRGYREHRFDESRSSLYQMGRILSDSNVYAISNQKLLLTGDAGIGKTHSLMNCAARLIDSDRHCLVIFGDDLKGDREIWQVVRDKIGYAPTVARDTLFGCLNAAGGIDRPFVLIIDALNESSLSEKLKSLLPEFVTFIKDYSGIKLLLSVRRLYLKDVIDDKSEIIQFSHSGFRGKRLEALRKFLKHAEYSFSKEVSPLFLDELDNPLFLKLLCRAHNDSRQRHFDVSRQGFGKLFKQLKTHSNEQIKIRMGHHRIENLISMVLSHLAELTENRNEILADDLIKKMHLTGIDPFELLDEIAREGFIISFRNDQDERHYVKFSYQRFSDYVMAEQILSQFNCNEPNCFSILNEKINQLVQYDGLNQGVLVDIATILLEKHQILLTDKRIVVSSHNGSVGILLDTIPWASAESLKLFAQSFYPDLFYQIKSYDSFIYFAVRMFKVSMIPDHPFNALFF